jgi:endo-1,4-beta-D-glucanase Y
MKPSAKTGKSVVVTAMLTLALSLLLNACSERWAPTAQWQEYLDRYYRQGRIVDTDNGGVSHSEGQGYGMLLAAHFGDRQRFAALWRWTRDTLGRDDGLFSWRYSPCISSDARCIDDPNNASDGDLLIAWALLRAAKVFDEPRYQSAARGITVAIRDELLVRDHGYLFVLPGRQGFV